MRIEGTLTKWNDDRGFGFITPTQGGSEIFVHISAFPKDGRRPAVGEKLSFEIETDATGKKKAKNLRCPARPAVIHKRQPVRNSRGKRPGLISRLVPLALLVALASYGYGEYSRRMSHPSIATPPSSGVASDFRCDGRTHCSQMTSCAEATFFLKNCPDVKMDGNNNSVPCEQQWCTGPFSK